MPSPANLVRIRQYTGWEYLLRERGDVVRRSSASEYADGRHHKSEQASLKLKRGLRGNSFDGSP